jgi:hypothetical protein
MSFKKPIWIVFFVVLGLAIIFFTNIAIRISNGDFDEETEATVVDDITTTSHITETTAVTAITTTSPETEIKTETETEHNDVPLWNVSPIDRINLDPLPEGAVYYARMGSQITIESENWECYYSGYKFSETQGTLKETAEESINYIDELYDWQDYEFNTEDPEYTTVAGFDAILYKSELHAYINSNDISNHIRHYFIFSKTGFYDIEFRSNGDILEKCEADWDYIISNVKIDDELKPEDVTSISAEVTVTW